MNRIDYKFFSALAPRWHMLNFQGQSFAQIARAAGVREMIVVNSVRRWRIQNNFLSPEEKTAEKLTSQRKMYKLAPDEKLMLRVLIDQSNHRLSTKVMDLAGITGLSSTQIQDVLRALRDKDYVSLRPGKVHKSYHAMPLADEHGVIYIPPHLVFDTGKDGVKRYKKPLYADGYVEESKDIGRIRGER